MTDPLPHVRLSESYHHRSARMRLAMLIDLSRKANLHRQRFTADDVTCTDKHWRRLVHEFRLRHSHPHCHERYWLASKFSQVYAEGVIARRSGPPRQTHEQRELRRKISRARKAGLIA